MKRVLDIASLLHFRLTLTAFPTTCAASIHSFQGASINDVKIDQGTDKLREWDNEKGGKGPKFWNFWGRRN